LEEKFIQEISAYEVHDEFRRKTKRKNESYSEYYYKMMDIAARIKMDEKTLIEYKIKGINDDGSDKNYLYKKYTRAERKTKRV